MKALLTTSAIVAFAALPAFAQQSTTTTEVTVAPEEVSGAFLATGEEVAADAAASDLIGQRVYASAAAVSDAEVTEVSEEWEDLGEIGDILVSRDGQVEAVVLDIGGFLGIGEKHVALKMDQIQMVNDADATNEFFLVTNLDRAAIESAPEFDMATVGTWAAETQEAAGAAVDSTGQAIENAATGVATGVTTATDSTTAEVNTTTTEGAQASQTVVEGTAPAPEGQGAEQAAGEQPEASTAGTEQTAQGSATTEAPTEAPAEGTDVAADGAATTEAPEAGSTDVAADSTATTEAPEAGSTDVAADSTAATEAPEAGSTDVAATETTEPPAEAGAEVAAGDAATEAPEQPDTEVAATTEGTTPPEQTAGTSTTETTVPVETTAPAAGGGMAPSMEREGWTTASIEDLTTEDLEGARLYDTNDELIGEVSQLIIDESGKITQAVLDVGGFLGIGEKSVALPMDELQIQRANEGGELRVYVNATEDDLKAMEEYQEQG